MKLSAKDGIGWWRQREAWLTSLRAVLRDL
jgi:hypothetical protein